MEYQPIKGTHDIFGKEMEEYRYVTDVFKAVSEQYGYHEIATPTLEYTDVFSRGAGSSSDIVRKEMYTFLDKGNRSVTMRPEFTAGVMRSIVSNKLYVSMDYPIKLSYCGPAFRYERPQLGRYRQFNQFGVESVGIDSPLMDAETVLLAYHCFSMLGFKDISLKVNTLGDDNTRKAYREALKGYFASRIDDMCEDCHARLELNPMRILDCKVPSDQEIAKGAPKLMDFLSSESRDRFNKTLAILSSYEIDYEIDENLVRGLDYYSEIVFEVHAKSKDGKDYGALCGGGHYGGLVKEFGGPDLAGVGFAVGVERIMSIMEEQGLFDHLDDGLDIYLMPIGEDMIPTCFEFASSIRVLGYSVEMPYSNAKMGSLFKKAEKRNAKVAIILGQDELDKGVVQVKNLKTKEQIEANIESLEVTLDHIFESFEEDEECTCGCHHHEDGHHCCHDHDEGEERHCCHDDEGEEHHCHCHDSEK